MRGGLERRSTPTISITIKNVAFSITAHDTRYCYASRHIMPSVSTLSVITLNDIMLSVVAPSEHLFFVTYDKLKCYITLG